MSLSLIVKRTTGSQGARYAFLGATSAIAAGFALRQRFPDSSTKAETRSPSIHVAQYNLLSDKLCSPEFFCYSPADACDNTKRLCKVKEKLEEQMAKKAILCLEEVSRDWGAELVTFFEKHDYAYAAALTGDSYTGYMGQCLAWPRSEYATEAVGTTRVADTIPMKDGDKRSGASSSGGQQEGFWARLLRWFNLMAIPKPLPFDPWKEAMRRHNCVVQVRLTQRSSGKRFCVAAYHMPCLFGSDVKCQVMVAHIALLLQHAQRWANNDPLIVAGDFNFKPVDPLYRLVIEGSLPKEHPQIPPPAPWDANWRPAVKPMRSAYAVNLGSEPSCTNYAACKNPRNDPTPFCATLDYVWLSPEWGVQSVVGPLPTQASLEAKGIKSYPDFSEPSDHLLIGAELTLL